MPGLSPRLLPLLFVVIVLLAAWLGRAQLAALLIESTLPDYGWSEVDADIDELGLKYSRVQGLGFVLATDTGRLRLEIEDAMISYDLRQLADRRVESLEIDRMVIGYDSGETPANKQDITGSVLEPIALIAGLRRAIREYIVFDTFSVRHLILKGEVFGPLQNLPLRLNGTNDRRLTEAELGIGLPEGPADPGSSDRLVRLLLSENHVAVKLNLQSEPELAPASIRFKINDTSVDGNYAIDPDSLQDWLQPFTGKTAIGHTSEITGDLAIDLSERGIISAQLMARTRNLELGGYSANSARASLRLSTPSIPAFERISIQRDSVIEAEGFGYRDIAFPGVRIAVDGDFIIADNGWKYSGNAATESLALIYASRTLSLKNISARIAGDSDALSVTGRFSPAGVPGEFGFKLAHRFPGKSGMFSVTPARPIDLNAGDYKLSQLITPWPFPFDLFAGSISLKADGAWSPQHDFRLAAAITLDKAGGNYRELVFSGLSSDHELEILPTLKSVRTGRSVIRNLDSGVTASNISARLTLRPASTGPLPQIMVQDLQGEIFDGSFSGDDFIYDLNSSKNRFEIKAENIDLARIVETQQLKDIVVTGKVDGRLPVEINDKGVFIEHGAFSNVVHTGTIRYNPAASEQLKQNPLTGIALDALRNFQYSHLSADVNFTPEGMLTVKLKLQGTSPELDTTRPVHLNINTEQNLLSLLKSLRYAEGISATIDRKVRRRYDKPTNNKRSR